MKYEKYEDKYYDAMPGTELQPQSAFPPDFTHGSELSFGPAE